MIASKDGATQQSLTQWSSLIGMCEGICRLSLFFVSRQNSTDVKLQFSLSMTVGCAEDVLKSNSCSLNSVMRQWPRVFYLCCGEEWPLGLQHNFLNLEDSS